MILWCPKGRVLLFFIFLVTFSYPLPFLNGRLIKNSLHEIPFFLVILVEARHLDYRENRAFFKSLAKHPSDGSKNGDVGHAWIYMEGMLEGKHVFIEGGHSGELGIMQPKYFDGVMDNVEYGSRNPIRYLWESQRDGFFQWGNGGHRPTFAAKIDLDQQQFMKILEFIENYNYTDYSLTGNQCSSFVAEVAALAGLSLEHRMKMTIAPFVVIEGKTIRLWKDSRYAEITFSSPDIIEKSLRRIVKERRAEDATMWYIKRHPQSVRGRFSAVCETVLRFPERLWRYLVL